MNSLLLLVASVVSSLSDAAYLLTKSHICAFCFLFARTIVMLVFSYTKSNEFQPSSGLSTRTYIILVFRSILVNIGSTFYYMALSYVSMGEAACLSVLSPMISCILASFLLKEVITRSEMSRMLFSLIGVFLIILPTLTNINSNNNWKVGYMMLGVVIMLDSVQQIMCRFLCQQHAPITAIITCQCAAFCLIGPFFSLQYEFGFVSLCAILCSGTASFISNLGVMSALRYYNIPSVLTI